MLSGHVAPWPSNAACSPLLKAESQSSMLGTDNVGAAPARIAGAFEGLKDVLVACSQKQDEQRSQIAELQKAREAQDQKLAALRQQVQELKARLSSGKAQKLARGTRATAQAVSDSRQLRGAAPGTSSTSTSKVPLPAVQEEIDPIDETKKVYWNGKIKFSRELLLKSLDEPPDTIDARMEPCLQELAEELGRPRTKPAPAPTHYSNQGARGQNPQSSSGRWVSQSGGWSANWKSHSNSQGAWRAAHWKPDRQGAWN